MTDSDMIAEYIVERVTCEALEPATTASIRKTLLQLATFVTDQSPPLLTEKNVVRWLANPRWSPSTRAGRLSQARNWTAWLARRRLIDVDPCEFLRGRRQVRKIPAVVCHEDVAKIFAQCRTVEDQLVISFMVQEALRCGEVAGLRWADLDLDAKSVFIRGKGRHERVLPISAGTQSLLDAVRQTSTASAVVAGRRARAAATSPGAMSQRVSAIMDRASVDASAHQLRATAATDMLSAGGNIRDVQSILGHARISTTGRYLRASLADLRKAIDGRRYLS